MDFDTEKVDEAPPGQVRRQVWGRRAEKPLLGCTESSSHERLPRQSRHQNKSVALTEEGKAKAEELELIAERQAEPADEVDRAGITAY